MLDDPRIKRLLKRYLKGDKFVNASIDVSSIPQAELIVACGLGDERSFASPIQLNDDALDGFARLTGIDFERVQFDYYLHSYIRDEFLEAYNNDPSITCWPAPEKGPPAKIPIPKGMRWVSVRPKDGEEHYEAWEYDESDKTCNPDL